MASVGGSSEAGQNPNGSSYRASRTTASGASCETITSLPFGDALATSGSCGDPSPMHFTGKEHDSESNLDNFGARYDSSSMGRFMSPDWYLKPQGVPYATFSDPQTLNLYIYVRNNPTTQADEDGHQYDDGAILVAGPEIDKMVWDHMSPGEKQLAVGIVSLATAAVGVGEITESVETAVTAADALKTAASGVATAGAFVNGTTQVIGAAANKDTDKGTTGVTAVTTPLGLATSLTTGSIDKGAAASDLQNAAQAVASPKNAVKDPGTVETMGSAISTIKGWFASPEPPSLAPPKPPRCTTVPTSTCS